MREIKFRGQRKDNNEWVIGDLCKGMSGIPCIMPEASFAARDFGERDRISKSMAIGGFYPVIPETAGQFTGLKDKNGVDIYEGDILENINGEVRVNNEWVPNKEISIVVWEDAAFALKSPGSEAIDWTHSSYYRESIVIGNIHSNPEFLK